MWSLKVQWKIEKINCNLVHMFVLFLCRLNFCLHCQQPFLFSDSLYYQAFSTFFHTHSFLERITGVPLSTTSQLEDAIKSLCNMSFSQVMIFIYSKCQNLLAHTFRFIRITLSWNSYIFMDCAICCRWNFWLLTNWSICKTTVLPLWLWRHFCWEDTALIECHSNTFPSKRR